MNKPTARPAHPQKGVVRSPITKASEIPVELTPDEVTRLWRSQDIDLSPNQLALLPRVQRWLERRKNNSLADLLVGKPVQEVSKQSTRELTADALARFKPRSTGVAVASLLTKIIDRGNRENITGGVCPPPIAILIKSQSSPFQAERWPKLELAGKLRLLLETSIRFAEPLRRIKNNPQTVARIALGQTLLSAIVHGGLIAPGSLTALLDQLNQHGSPLQCLGGRLFVELSLTHNKQENSQFLRWYPDALSSVLILNTPLDLVRIAADKESLDNDELKKLIWPCLRALIKSCNATIEFPDTLNKLLDAVRLDLEYQIPIYLVNYAALTVVSHSLKPSVYRRIHGLPVDPKLDKAENEIVEQGLGSPGTGIVEDLKPSDDVEPRWLYALRGAMKGTDSVVIVQNIKKLLQSDADGFKQSDVGNLFAGFAHRLLTTSNDNHVKVAVSTAKAYVFSVCTRLGGQIGLSVSSFGNDEWTSLYEEALADSETPGVRRKLVRVLREFHRYLELERGAEKINSAEIFGIGAGLVPVDANIVTDQEFVKIRARFAQGTATDLPSLATAQDGARLTELSWLILTLAYRCGLRRMEILKIELVDVLVHHFPELLVRPNEYRRLKTKSSTRKIPLFALLTGDEIERLRQWCNRRIDEEKQSSFSNFLFSLPARGMQFVPQDSLFKLLHRVMRDVTGDESLRFHHLRHSFASRMFVLFAANTPMLQARVLETLPGYANSFVNADPLRIAIFGKAGPTRRLVWAVCCLLGHSGPDVSLEHYIHHLDILLAESLATEPISPSVAVVYIASGKSSAQAYRHRQGESLDTWAAHLFKKQIKDKIPESSPAKQRDPEASNSTSISVAQEDAQISIGKIWACIFEIKTSGKPIAEISQRLGVDIKKLQTYSSNADWLFSLKRSENSSVPIHRFMQWTPDLRHPEAKQTIAVPVDPAEERDKKVIVRLGAKFREIYMANSKLIQDVVMQYACEARHDFGGMVFKDPNKPNDAIDFLDFLKKMGLQKDEIEFISYDVTTKRSPLALKWRKVLGLHSSIKISRKTPFNNRMDWACPWLGILPVFPDDHGKKMGSAGFRFLMVIAAITLRRENDTQAT